MDNVIRFPPRGRPAANRLGLVTAALCLLGEPARADELSVLLQAAGLARVEDLTPAAVTEILNRHGPAAAAFPMFRRVSVGGAEAWAFARDYRTLLREAGIAAPLRETVGGDLEALPDLIAARGLLARAAGLDRTAHAQGAADDPR
ncbi:hypothetical protein [Phenylobacterium aquaticum]|uniref:hypothetical protein n=1 Tax=Phenylobacterium aquaticum TaxID=1763816 RepID=UPI001F5C42EA|nr:hypothetical protein [Phenylobacterium aquaticum]MCI3135636.1 hypothetical protein [Phenylobacterium aquaticum]